MLFLGLPPTLPNLFHDSAQGPDSFIRVPLLHGSLHSTETDGFIMSLNKQINRGLNQQKRQKSQSPRQVINLICVPTNECIHYQLLSTCQKNVY